MSGSSHTPRSLEGQLLGRPRRAAGVDSSGERARLDERDSGGHLVGCIDADGLAWQSLKERIVAIPAPPEPTTLLYDDPYRDQRIDEVLGEVPTS
jgi:hypothetical protein